MEFEDQTALSQAYSEAPMSFEQALLAARLEAKQAAEVGFYPLSPSGFQGFRVVLPPCALAGRVLVRCWQVSLPSRHGLA